MGSADDLVASDCGMQDSLLSQSRLRSRLPAPSKVWFAGRSCAIHVDSWLWYCIILEWFYKDNMKLLQVKFCLMPSCVTIHIIIVFHFQIPASAVEMPESMNSTMLDVQFGNWDSPSSSATDGFSISQSGLYGSRPTTRYVSMVPNPLLGMSLWFSTCS